MMSFIIFSLSLLAQLVGCTNLTVNVGKPVYKFGPPLIEKAAVGDVVIFEFYSPEHSVVRADAGSPCIPYENYHSGQGGFFSGMKPVGVGDPPSTWVLNITSLEPIFFYCSALGSCLNYKMVGGINMNQSTLDRQIKTITKDTVMLQPGDTIPAEGTQTPVPHPHAHLTLSTPVIIGIAVGGAAVLTLAGLLFFFVGRAKTLQELLGRRNTSTHSQSCPQDRVHDRGFEGCTPIKEEQPPGYPHSPVREGSVHPVYPWGSGCGPPRSSTTSPRLEAWRMSVYDGPPQEMEAQGGHWKR